MNPFLMFSIVNLKRETHLAVCRCRVTCSTQMGRSMTSAHWSKWATASWWTTVMTASTSTSTSAGASVSPSVPDGLIQTLHLCFPPDLFSLWMLVVFNLLLCSSDLPGKSCPEGSAACVVKSQGSFDMGFPTKPLELVSNDRCLHVPVKMKWNTLTFPQIIPVFYSLSETGVFILGIFSDASQIEVAVWSQCKFDSSRFLQRTQASCHHHVHLSITQTSGRWDAFRYLEAELVNLPKKSYCKAAVKCPL